MASLYCVQHGALPQGYPVRRRIEFWLEFREDERVLKYLQISGDDEVWEDGVRSGQVLGHTMQSCRGRLIAHLLEQQDEVGVVKITGSREDLARRLGVSRAALFRELSALQSMGTVSVDGNSITVEDRPLLEELLYHPSNTK